MNIKLRKVRFTALLGVMGSHHQPSDPESDALHIELTPMLSLTH